MAKKNKKGILKEFGDFALKGNVMDLAVGVIIGASFQSIVNSMVKDVIMPIIGRLVGNIDYSNMFIILGDTKGLDPKQLGQLEYLTKANVPVLAYGSFLTAVINFVIMAFIIFMMVKGISKLRDIKLPLLHKEEAAEEPAAPTTKICPYCKSEIDITATRCPHCTSVLDE